MNDLFCSVLSKAADFVTDGTDGKIHYVTEDGDIDQDGEWYLQARVVIGTRRWSSNIKKIQVYPNIQDPT